MRQCNHLPGAASRRSLHTPALLRSVLVAGALVLGFAGIGAAGQEKIDVCHLEGNGSYHLINIAEPAFQSHIDHGDGGPGDPVPSAPGFVFDDACNLVVACPCASEGNALALNALFEAQDFMQGPVSTTCKDDVFPTFSELVVVRRDGQVATEPELLLQTNDFFRDPFCVYRVLDAAGNALVDIFAQVLTDEEYAACQADIRRLLDQLVDCP